jgi:hypothetical protein
MSRSEVAPAQATGHSKRSSNTTANVLQNPPFNTAITINSFEEI